MAASHLLVVLVTWCRDVQLEKVGKLEDTVYGGNSVEQRSCWHTFRHLFEGWYIARHYHTIRCLVKCFCGWMNLKHSWGTTHHQTIM